MSCPYKEQDRVRFAYGEMEQKDAEKFQIHLSNCPDCRRELAELESLASLTERIVAQPDPIIQWSEDVPALHLAKAKPDRRTIWAWVGAFGTMAASAAAVFLLLSQTQPKRVNSPIHSRTQNSSKKQQLAVIKNALPKSEKSSPKGLSLANGRIRLLRSGKKIETIASSTRLLAGDRISSEKDASVKTDDGSRVFLSKGSTLALMANDDRGERWDLEQGTIVCHVTPRSASRPFAVQAGPGVVTVKGTRFAIQLHKGKLSVAVSEGVVEVASRNTQGAMVDLHAGQQATLDSMGILNVSPTAKPMKKILEKAAEPVAALATAAKPTRHLSLIKSAKGRQIHKSKKTVIKAPLGKKSPEKALESSALSAEAPITKTSAQQEVKDSPGVAAHSMAEILSKDTNWIFDGIKADMRHHNFDDAIRKLDNYLDDPSAPQRPEALFLKALCLEQKGNKAEAISTFELYLQRWPTGKRAKEAKTRLSDLRQ